MKKINWNSLEYFENISYKFTMTPDETSIGPISYERLCKIFHDGFAC